MTPAVIFLIFNRPALTAQSFAAIRKARPAHLLVVADGPRPSRPDEAALCEETRRITEAVDWPCTVLRNYAPTNIGCGPRIATGLTWAFEQVEEAVILEDDCLPDPSFFPYCHELLERYRDQPRVLMISGDNFHGGRTYGDADYFFSRYQHIWGWATWRRAWAHYDFTMRRWPELRPTLLAAISSDRLIQDYWRHAFDAVAAGKIDTWDYQWLFSAWAADGISISPRVNLVGNIGLGADATHTKSAPKQMTPPCLSLTSPLRHPNGVTISAKADRYEERGIFLSWKTRLRMRLRRLLGR